MPKIKSRRSVRKRFRITGKGKVKRAQGNRSHLLTKRSPNRMRRLRRKAMLHKTGTQMIKKLLPYG